MIALVLHVLNASYIQPFNDTVLSLECVYFAYCILSSYAMDDYCLVPCID